ncbi:MAG: glycosyltransferase [Deltaproteobacteria bacterium]|nr:glycosyltransferase [Deltaproteobacteria bacterium]
MRALLAAPISIAVTTTTTTTHRLAIPAAASGWVRLDFTVLNARQPHPMPRLLFRELLDLFAFRHPGTARYSVYFDLKSTGHELAIDVDGDVTEVWLHTESRAHIAIDTLRRHRALWAELLGDVGSALARRAGREAVSRAKTAVLRISVFKNAPVLRGSEAERAWLQADAPTSSSPSSSSSAPRLSFVLDAGGRGFASTVASLVAQSEPAWELLVWEHHLDAAQARQATAEARVRVIGGAEGDFLGECLKSARGAWLAFVSAGDRLAVDAVASLLGAAGSAVMVYGDEDQIDDDGTRHQLVLKPAWSPEFLESAFYTGRGAAYRIARVRELGGLRSGLGGALEYELALRLTEGDVVVGHVARVLYHRSSAASGGWGTNATSAPAALQEHMQRTGAGGVVVSRTVSVSGRPRTLLHPRFAVRGTPKVSVVIPTAGRTVAVRGQPLHLLSHCLRSVQTHGGWPHLEVVVVHNGDLTAGVVADLNAAGCVLVEYRGSDVNIALKMNMGARASSGDLLLFLNDDIEAISRDFIVDMIGSVQRDGVGGVGAKLYFEDGTIQHAGVALASSLPATVGAGLSGAACGPAAALCATRNYLAVTGACLMTPRAIFEAVGGFDEQLKVNYNDIDYCVSLLKNGYRVVLNPTVELFHFESKSRDPEKIDWDEAVRFAHKSAQFARRDPYYSSAYAGSGVFALRV